MVEARGRDQGSCSRGDEHSGGGNGTAVPAAGPVMQVEGPVGQETGPVAEVGNWILSRSTHRPFQPAPCHHCFHGALPSNT